MEDPVRYVFYVDDNVSEVCELINTFIVDIVFPICVWMTLYQRGY
jgi:hypothetical protein